MKDLASHDLYVRSGTGVQPDEKRFELRIFSTNDFVGWFETNPRLTKGDRAVSINAQFVHRAELTDAQATLAKAWLHGQILSAL
ncbi:MAG: hypothetical protein AAB472_01410 [Patescibacteria group bacterium]